LLRHRLRRRATRRGRWRGRLSRWRLWHRRSLSGCRAGCHQSCQDQKKRFSLHGEQMLPRYHCSLLVRNRLAYSVYRSSGFVFRGGRCRTQPSGAKTQGPFQQSDITDRELEAVVFEEDAIIIDRLGMDHFAQI
jgi:hypothetical protein